MERDLKDLFEAELRGEQLANAQLQRADWVAVEAVRCRLTGVAFNEARLDRVTFRECPIDLASFGSARLHRVTFEDCMLTQTDFLEAQLTQVRFHRCDLTQADVRGAKLRECELRRCTLDGLVGVPSLRGAAMEWPDILDTAGAMAHALGIGVLDPGAPQAE